MRLPLLLLALLVSPALADEPLLRPSARLLFKYPELLQPGHCVRYEEGGAGWVITDPLFYLKGSVVAAEVRTRRLQACPEVPDKELSQYSRAEYVRLALAQPCLQAGTPERDEQIGVVRLRVTDWETPHARRAENAGRLYRGMFIDRPLARGMEIELEADALAVCEK
ncbi:MAG: hypothetical protein F9K30_08550 [Dechloromonas sp.]|nr:MAG: hypothetical protein F9K30_08550 [Dechloromonas sp.]